MNPHQTKQGVARAALVIALLGVLIGLAVNLGDRPLSAHEVFAAQTAREMVRSGDWVSPTYNGVSRLKKPPLAYWAQGGVSVVLGTEPPVPAWAARLASALAGGALAGLTVLLGARVYGRRTGVTAGVVVCGFLGLAEYGSSARPDMLYASCCTLAVWGWASSSLRAPGERGQRRDALIGWLGAGLATLAKGPHVLLILAAGVVAHFVAARRARDAIAALRPVLGLGVLGAVTLPWFGAVLARHPDALALWRAELFSGRGPAQRTPLLEWLTPFYLYAIPLITFPWALALPFALFVPFVRGRADLARGRVVWWMALACALLMSLSNHRRDYYMLPILAPLAVLISAGASDWLARRLARGGEPDSARAHRVLRVVGVLAAALWAALAPTPLMHDRYDDHARRFARLIGETLPPDATLVFFRLSDRTITYAQTVYTLDRTVPAINEPAEVARAARELGAVWAVLTMDDLPALEGVVIGEVVAETPADDPGEPTIALVKFTPAP
ncbi:MAG TPA: hypothetical protein DEB06_04565 [Phycisphaerales bacterium]|nr:hypothetical protein [Phycisphaerales bacterium]